MRHGHNDDLELDMALSRFMIAHTGNEIARELLCIRGYNAWSRCNCKGCIEMEHVVVEPIRVCLHRSTCPGPETQNGG